MSTNLLQAIEAYLCAHRHVAAEHVKPAALAVISAMASGWKLPDERPLLFGCALYDDPRSGGAILGALHRLVEAAGMPMLFRASREHPDAIAVNVHPGIEIPQQRCFRIAERPAFLPDERPESVKPPLKLIHACQRFLASTGVMRLCFSAVSVLGSAYSHSDDNYYLDEAELQKLAHSQITTAALISLGDGRSFVSDADIDAAVSLFLQNAVTWHSQIRTMDAVLH